MERHVTKQRDIQQYFPRRFASGGRISVSWPQRNDNIKTTWTRVSSGYTGSNRLELHEMVNGWVGKKTLNHPVIHHRELFGGTLPAVAYGPLPGTDITTPALARKFGFMKGSTTVANTSVTWNVTKVGTTSIIPSAPAPWAGTLDWVSCLQSLLDDARGILPTQKSLALNILEFKQLKGLIPGISKSIKNILKWVSGHPNKTITVNAVRLYRGRRVRFKKTVKASSLKWTLRDLADLHLSANFGVMPLASDLGDLAGKLFEARTHLAWFAARNYQKPVVLRASVSGQDHETTVIRETSAYVIRRADDRRTTGTLYAKAWITPISEDARSGRLLNQIIGLNTPLQILWELVPFSFVVDWFLPVGRLLNNFEPKSYFGSLAAKVDVVERWTSTKSEASSTMYVDPVSQDYIGSTGMWIPQSGAVRHKAEDYIRTNGWPDFNWASSLRGTGFTLRQAGLSLSLLIQRIFK